MAPRLRKSKSEEPDLTLGGPPSSGLIGEMIQHGWQEKAGTITQWKGLVLDQMEINPSLYLVKYDGFDSVYGIELFKDERVKKLKIVPKRVVKTTRDEHSKAEELVGKAVEHVFIKDDDSKVQWRGMVLSRAPILSTCHYITYEKDPVLYMYNLLEDYQDGELRILSDEENKTLLPPVKGCDGEDESLAGKPLEYINEKGVKKVGRFIYQVPARPSVYFLKFDDDVQIYVYALVKSL